MRELIIATSDRLESIAKMETEIFGDARSVEALGIFCGEGGFCAVCLENDVPVGYCTVMLVLDEAQIIDLGTDPSFRRQGIARDVMGLVLSECEKRGIATVSLEVRRSNFAAIELYSSLGFATVGERRNFYSAPREDALVMVKEI